MKYIILLLISFNVYASGLSGLNYETYIGGGPSPSRVNRTLISSGTLSTVNYNWGGGAVMGTNYGDGIIVHVYGYIQAPTTGTYNFGTTSDDGTILKVNNITLVNCWCEQGPTFRYGSITLTSGQVVPVDIWYYENGGGAVLQFYWNISNSWQIVPSTVTSTDSSYWAPSLCCGASSNSFNVNAIQNSKIQTFINRTGTNNQVYIEQIGNNNDIVVNQSGSPNNYLDYYGNGSFNTITTNQSSSTPSSTNYSEITVNGDSNVVSLTQQSTGGTKTAFIDVTNNNNNITLQQKDSGNDYANISVSGGNKNINILQQGSGSHRADVSLSGTPTSLDLTQSGNTQQFYSISFNCNTVGGCPPISVQQQ